MSNAQIGIPDKVRRFIDDNALLNNADRVLVALSGGADSVALLHILISIKEKYNIGLYAAHFNHGIRGAEADRDERFVTELCKELDISLFCEKADVPAIASESGESLELCGRRLRYDFLDRVADELGGALTATAHHMDDNAETVVWNLTRGSGLAGLAGIPPKRDAVIRPLLCLTRAEIEEYCRVKGLSYVTDSTNLSDDYTRNKLRHRVMPVLRELNPGASESIFHTAQLMREADGYLDKISLSELKSAETKYGYSCEKLLNSEPVILKYAVKNVLEKADAPVDHDHITLIIEAMRTGGAVNLGCGFTASCAQGILRVIRDSDNTGGFCVPFSEYIKAHGKRLTVKDGVVYCLENGKKINNLLLKHCIPCDIITCNTVFRTRAAGDTFTDARRGVTKSLKKLMNELKLPRELRDTIPVIAEGSTILWLQGYGTSAQAMVDLTRDGDIFYIEG